MTHDETPDPAAGPARLPTDRDEEARRVAEAFRRFARRETRLAPVYGVLIETVADDRDLLDIVLQAPPSRRIPNLILAAVHALLAEHQDAPLAAYYATLGGDRAADAELPAAFRSFVAAHRPAIEELVRTRDTQTNEVQRLPQLRPAFGWVGAQDDRPMALIEIGTSAGLLLHPDAYRYEYVFDDGSVLSSGDADAPQLRCRVPDTAADALAPYVSGDLAITTRTGIDRHPLDPTDPEARRWLRALIWAGEVERLARLDLALGVTTARSAGNLRPRLLTGDALDLLPQAVAAVPEDRLPCVFASNVLMHFDPVSRARFAELVRELAAQHDFVVILKENWDAGLGLFAERPETDTEAEDAEPYETLGVVLATGGALRVVDLGAAGYHGGWLRWRPAEVDPSTIRAL